MCNFICFCTSSIAMAVIWQTIFTVSIDFNMNLHKGKYGKLSPLTNAYDVECVWHCPTYTHRAEAFT